MKLAFITNFYVPEMGMNTYYLARGLGRLGVDLTFFTSDKYGRKKPPTVWKDDTYDHPFNLCKVGTSRVIANIPFMQGLDIALKRESPFDIIMTEDAYQFYSNTAMNFAKRHGIPLVLRHDLYQAPSLFPYNVAFKLVERFYSRSICDYAVSAIVPTDEAKRYLLCLNKNLSVTIIPFGVDTDLFNTNYDSLSEAHKIGINDERVLKILCVSRLVHSKGMFDLLEVIRELVKRDPNTKLFLIGRGPIEPQLHERAISYGIAKNVLFIPYVSHDEIHHYYKMCDAFILPSYEEAPGLSVSEAMACGKPVVASNIPGVRDYITDLENGILVSPKDTAGFVKAIISIRDSPDFAASLGTKAAISIEQKYSWSRVSERTLDILRSSLN